MTSTLATIPVHQRTRATLEQAIDATATSPDGTTPEQGRKRSRFRPTRPASTSSGWRSTPLTPNSSG